MGRDLSASELRQNIYRILDYVLETNEPVVIDRKGRKLRIVAAEQSNRIQRIIQAELPAYVAANPEELVHLDWSSEWTP